MIKKSSLRKLAQRKCLIASCLKEFEDIRPDDIYISPFTAVKSLYGITTEYIGMEPDVSVVTCRDTYSRSSSNVPFRNRRSSRSRYISRGPRESDTIFLPLSELDGNRTPSEDIAILDDKKPYATKTHEVLQSASPSSPSVVQAPANDVSVCVPNVTSFQRNGDSVNFAKTIDAKDYSHYVDVHRLLDSVTPSCFLTGTRGHEPQPSSHCVVPTTQAGVKEAHLLPPFRNSHAHSHTGPTMPCSEKTELAPPKHPFLHFWEYDDDCVFARDWRPRREMYLMFHSLKHPSDALVPNVSRSIHFPETSEHRTQPKISPKGVSVRKQQIPLLRSPCNGFVSSESTVPSDIQPCLLGCRLPTDCDAFRDPTGFLRDECELMVLWP
ncbi:unnamed protein product [Dicrocoelium dendriticum]|nr:unnamed protein product [Dicrocoelium dendriticum]